MYKIIISEINECISSPCQNGGNCHDQINQYNCSCLPGFNGTHCENGFYYIIIYYQLLLINYDLTLIHFFNSTDINECNSNPCHNNASCSQYIDFFNCSCPLGFNGTLCDHS